ncbi:MAG: flavoprotein [Lactovum sp.]
MKKNILLGITASIAAHKLPSIVEKLREDYNIYVVMTENACQFVSPLTLEVLSQNKVKISLYSGEQTKVDHVELAQNTDLILIAPASTNLIGKYANGIADNLLTSILMVANPKKVILCPAMNDNMYQHPIVQENLQKLKRFSVKEIEPIDCLLASGKRGKGGLAPFEIIKSGIDDHFKKNKSL